MEFTSFAAFVESINPRIAGNINRIPAQDTYPSSRLMQFFERLPKEQLLDNALWNKFHDYQPVLSGVVRMNNLRAQVYSMLAPAIGPLLKEPGSSAVSLYDGIPADYQKAVQNQRLAALIQVAKDPQGLHFMSGQGRISTERGNIDFYSSVMRNPDLTWVIPTMTQHQQLKKLIPSQKLYEFAQMYPALKPELNLSNYEKVKMTLREQNPLNTAIHFGSHIPSKDDYSQGLETIER